MKILQTISFFIISICIHAQEYNSPLRYLALGDSYTIGQSVSYNERWPTILKDSLANRGILVDTLAYIATTGWRTDNLMQGINSKKPDSNYNLVSLLIGVNNQYQRRNFSQYKAEFPELLKQSIALAQDNKKQVFVVSIPDYAFTTFGGNGYKKSISDELDEYNDYAKYICDSIGIIFYDITPISRSGTPGYVAIDGLHPSGKQYNDWVNYILQNRTVLNTLTHSHINNYLYPNPSRDVINLFNYESTKHITIYNTSGKLIKRISPNSNKVNHNLNKGVYIIDITLKNNNTIKTQLIVE